LHLFNQTRRASDTIPYPAPFFFLFSLYSPPAPNAAFPRREVNIAATYLFLLSPSPFLLFNFLLSTSKQVENYIMAPHLLRPSSPFFFSLLDNFPSNEVEGAKPQAFRLPLSLLPFTLSAFAPKNV